MGDEELTDEEALQIIPEAVRDAYAEEERFIAHRVEAMRKAGETWYRQLTEYIPYIDLPMTEQEIGPAAATSDVNREARKALVIKHIEDRLGFELDEETRNNIRADVNAMYNGDYSDE